MDRFRLWSLVAVSSLLQLSCADNTLDKVGSWGKRTFLPVIPAAGAIIPEQPYSGNFFAWSSYQAGQFGITLNEKYTTFATWDYRTETIKNFTIANTQHDMFCPGISFDFDGRLIVTGGDTENATSIYDAKSNRWIKAAEMNIPRGYQSSTTTSEGKIFTIGGSWSGGKGGKIGEIYDPTIDRWTRLPGCPVDPILTADAGGVYRADNHAWLFGWKDGSVFQAGPSDKMHWFGTKDSGSIVAAGIRGSGHDSMCGPSVMYDVGKIFTVGGAGSYEESDAWRDAHIITIDKPNTPAKAESVGQMNYARMFGNAVLLPDGKVFIVGGMTWAKVFSDGNASLVPELWDPATKSFTQLAKGDTARNYHSIAILLPDGSVIAGGGGLCSWARNDCKLNPSVDHYDIQRFYPPYLYRKNELAQRPVISSVATSQSTKGLYVKVGGWLRVRIKQGATKHTTFSLLRMGSVTHSVNTDQRRIPLTAKRGRFNIFTMNLPKDPGVLLPGYYYLFALADAVPSVAMTIQVRL